MSAENGHQPLRIRFIADHNFRASIIEGLRRLRPEMDIVTALEVGLPDRPDPELLRYAKEQGRLLLTHDKRTMPGHFNGLLLALPQGEHSPGGFVVPQKMAIGPAVAELLLIWEASAPEEWEDRLTFLPL